MRPRTPPARARLYAAIAVTAVLCAVAGAAPLASLAASSVGSLKSRLGALGSRAQDLSARTGHASQAISGLDGQISLVSQREADVQARLSANRAALASVEAAVTREQALVVALNKRLARARRVLARQLVGQYESPQPDLVSVVLQARGFADLLDRLQYLNAAEHQSRSIVHATAIAKQQAQQAAARLASLRARDQAATDAIATTARAVSAMNALLHSKRSALYRVRGIAAAELNATRATRGRLARELSVLEAQQAAPVSVSAPASSGSTSSGSSAPVSAVPSGGWAIPAAIVICESGGQNLPPNSAGASGYYQIVPGTWKGEGGSGPAAYLAPKSEQDRVASLLWNNGAGASNWVCAGIVGIH